MKALYCAAPSRGAEMAFLHALIAPKCSLVLSWRSSGTWLLWPVKRFQASYTCVMLKAIVQLPRTYFLRFGNNCQREARAVFLDLYHSRLPNLHWEALS